MAISHYSGVVEIEYKMTIGACHAVYKARSANCKGTRLQQPSYTILPHSASMQQMWNGSEDWRLGDCFCNKDVLDCLRSSVDVSPMSGRSTCVTWQERHGTR
jgi:hypothetical protein